MAMASSSTSTQQNQQQQSKAKARRSTRQHAAFARSSFEQLRGQSEIYQIFAKDFDDESSRF
jgi:hypothetical protein